MAVIDYVVTKLSNKRFIVEWPGLVNINDTGQPFDASEAKFESAHRFNSGSLIINLYVSNESGAPVNDRVVPEKWIDRSVIWDSFLVSQLPFRWFIPKILGGSTGVPGMYLLFREE